MAMKIPSKIKGHIDKYRLRYELAMSVSIKLIMVMVIAHLFFSQPIEKSLTPKQYQQHFFSN